MVPVAFDATVQATSRVRSVSSDWRSARFSRPALSGRHQTMRAPARSSASQVAMLASWSSSLTTISGLDPRVCPIARLIERMNDVALRPKAISSAVRALTNAATLSRARAIIASTSRECRYGPPRWTLRVDR